MVKEHITAKVEPSVKQKLELMAKEEDRPLSYLVNRELKRALGLI